MGEPYTNFMRSFEPTGEPTQEAFDAAWTALRSAIRGRLNRRGLWDSPPRWLGVVGASWVTAESQNVGGAPRHTRDALDELTSDCFSEIFVERMPSLRRYVDSGDRIEGVVSLALQQVLNQRHERCDRLGYDVYQRLRAALSSAVANGRLYSDDDSVYLSNTSILCFKPGAIFQRSSADSALQQLQAEVRRWNDAGLFRAWLSVYGRDVQVLIDELEVCVLSLAAVGVEVFTFKALVDALKLDFRARLEALRSGPPDAGALAAAAFDDPLAAALEMERFEQLSACVKKGVDGLDVQHRTREQLRRLWAFLEAFARAAAGPGVADLSAGQGSGALFAALQEENLPSYRQLAKLLGIRHDRFSSLMARLRVEVERCASNTATLKERAQDHGPEAKLDNNVDFQQELRQRLAAAYRRDALPVTPETEAPRSGDLLRLAATPEPGIEWLLVEIDDATAQALLLPVDSLAWIGSCDIAMTAALVCRCGHGLWLNQDVVGEQRSVGRVAETDLEKAQQHYREVRDGNVAATDTEHEIDADPEYRGWLKALGKVQEEVLAAHAAEPGGTVYGGAGPGAEEPLDLSDIEVFLRKRSVRGHFLRPLKLAASVTVVVALGWMAFSGGRLVESLQVGELSAQRDSLNQELARQRESEARFKDEIAAVEERFNERIAALEGPEAMVPWRLIHRGRERGQPEPFTVPEGTRSVLLLITIEGRGRVEIRGRDGETVHTAEIVERELGQEATILLPARLLPPAPYEVIVWEQSDGQEKEVTRRRLRIERP